MTKADFVSKVSAKSGLSKKDSESALNSVLACLSEAMQSGDSVTFTGFGSFKIVERSARKGRNPQTGKEIKIAASKAVKFTPGKTLKDSVK